MITAHKKLYENHAEDLTALKKRYEHHAKDCVRVAELPVDPDGVSSISSWRASGPKRTAALQGIIDETDAAENRRPGSFTARKTN